MCTHHANITDHANGTHHTSASHRNFMHCVAGETHWQYTACKCSANHPEPAVTAASSHANGTHHANAVKQPVCSALQEGLIGSTQLANAQQTVQRLQSQLQAVMPRFQELMSRPGAAEIRSELTKGLSERAIARAVKLVFNQNQPSAIATQTSGSPNAYLPSAGVQGSRNGF